MVVIATGWTGSPLGSFIRVHHKAETERAGVYSSLAGRGEVSFNSENNDNNITHKKNYDNSEGNHNKNGINDLE